MTVFSCCESEGITVCCGDLSYSRWQNDLPYVYQFAAKVAWGMGSVPLPQADSLVVGGSLIDSYAGILCTTGNARIGGSVSCTRGGTFTTVSEEKMQSWLDDGLNDPDMPPTSWQYIIDNSDSNPDWIPYADAETRRRYQDIQNGTRVSTGLGRAEALKATAGADLSTIDYSTYVEDKLRPMSETLKNLPVTGSASYAKCGHVHHRIQNNDYVDSDVDAWLILTGDGTSLLQVFELDADELASTLAELGCRQWSVDLENVPSDASVVVNVNGDCKEWRPGYLNRWNGESCDTYVNDVNSSDGFKAYVRMASAILWNFHETSNLLVAGSVGSYNGAPIQENIQNSLMPGSILVPYGDAHIIPDTNGHVLCSGDMSLDIIEHHNVPWRGSLMVPTIDIPVEKVWEGAGCDKFAPDSVTVRLYGNGEEVALLTLSGTNGWQGAFEDLPEVDYYWEPISYVVREDEVAHFTAKVTGSETVGFTVTNTLMVPNYTNVGVRKVWTGEGAAENLPDELVVHVVGSDGSDRSVTLTRAGHWQATIDELPQLDSAGEWITYTLEERDVPAGFALVSIDGDVESGWTVTNEHQKGRGGLTKEARNKSWL